MNKPKITKIKIISRISLATLLMFLFSNLSYAATSKSITLSQGIVGVLDVTLGSTISSKTVTADSKNVSVVAINLRAQNAPITLKSLTFTRVTTLTPTADQNSLFTLKNGDGSILTNYKKPFDPSNPETLNFANLNLKIKQNEIKTIQLIGDIADLTDKSYNFSVNINKQTDIIAINTTSTNIISPRIIINDGDGANYTDPFNGPNQSGQVKITVNPVIKPKLSVSLYDAIISRTIVKSSQNENLVGFRFTAKNDDIYLKNLTLTCYISEDNDNTFSAGSEHGISITEPVSSLALYQDFVSESNKLGLKTPNSTTGQATFGNLNLFVPQSQTKTVIVTANFNQPAGSTPDKVACDIAGTTDVIAQDKLNNSINLSNSAPNQGVNPIVSQTLVTSGSIIITDPLNFAPNQIVPASSTNILAARFRVLAATENMQIQKMTIKIKPATANRDIARLIVKYPTSNFEPYNLNGLAIATAPRPGTSDTFDFTGLTFAVPKDSPAVQFEIYVDINPAQIIVPGDTFQLIFNGEFDSIFKAVGQTSASVKTEADIYSILSPAQITIR